MSDWIYRSGNRIHVTNVTWEDLCDCRTYVPPDVDHSRFPCRITGDAINAIQFLYNFVGEPVRNWNKTSGNGEEATREPDLNSAARKPMQ